VKTRRKWSEGRDGIGVEWRTSAIARTKKKKLKENIRCSWNKHGSRREKEGREEEIIG